jgi:hypothetical protein
VLCVPACKSTSTRFHRSLSLKKCFCAAESLGHTSPAAAHELP